MAYAPLQFIGICDLLIFRTLDSSYTHSILLLLEFTRCFSFFLTFFTQHCLEMLFNFSHKDLCGRELSWSVWQWWQNSCQVMWHKWVCMCCYMVRKLRESDEHHGTCQSSRNIRILFISSGRSVTNVIKFDNQPTK